MRARPLTAAGVTGAGGTGGRGLRQVVTQDLLGLVATGGQHGGGLARGHEPVLVCRGAGGATGTRHRRAYSLSRAAAATAPGGVPAGRVLTNHLAPSAPVAM